MWISLSLLYEEGKSSTDLASSLLASLLWSRLTGANVVVQVYNRTEIVDTRHLAWLNQMTDNQIIVLYGPVQQNVDDVCDLALETALSKMLLSSKLSAR